MTKFSGSYHESDVEFLLNPIEMQMTSIEEKEALIQSKQMHYSDMLSQEPEPSQEHLAIYANALTMGENRLATEVLMLAKALIKKFANKPIVLASLVRAGVPLGVLLHRSLKDLGHDSYHYGISIIRDRGIDNKALNKIENKHGTEAIVFVDGWTGKGAIINQLVASLANRQGYPEKPRLVVLADPCGKAWLSASNEDWLIPFGILGAPISGLVSRSVWSANDYHGCVLCEHLAAFDCSATFVDHIHAIEKKINRDQIETLVINDELNQELEQLSHHVIFSLQQKYNIDSTNRIKPGIAEATRAVLRRVPDHILVRDINDRDVSLLVMLAKKKGIKIEQVGSELGQYRAATIIKKVL